MLHPILKSTLLCAALAACGGAASAADPDIKKPVSSPEIKKPSAADALVDAADDVGSAAEAAPVAGEPRLHWVDEFWRSIYATPAPQNPQVTLDLDCATTPTGSPVTYLNGYADFGDHVRTCHIPRGNAVMFGVGDVNNSYPCPDPSFQPGPGQTLESFLALGAAQILRAERPTLYAQVDGRQLVINAHDRITSPLFSFKGDVSMQGFDSCITGSWQVGISDGYYYFLQGLKPGTHQVTWGGSGGGMSYSQILTLVVD